MTKILLDFESQFDFSRAISVQLEKIDIDRGTVKLPTKLLPPMRDLKLAKTAKVGDIIHMPTPSKTITIYREREDGDQSQE